MKGIALIVLSMAVLGCQKKPAPLPTMALAPGEKTANHLVSLTMPDAFMDYASQLAACDHWIHMDFDAMHENILDLRVRRAEREACTKALVYVQKNP